MTLRRVLIIAGSDSGGGAGIQADIKASSALGAYASTAITALTAQNTCGVQAVYPIPPGFIAQQMEAVLTDIGTDCIKTGLLHDAAVIEAVYDILQRNGARVPLVVDPVMVAQSGDRLLEESAVEALVNYLLPRAALVTPNIPEAEVLLGESVRGEAGQHEAAEALRRFGCAAALVKGGHADGDEVVDVLATASGTTTLRYPRIDTTSTHGTGCTLASAIAAGLAAGRELPAAVGRARAYLQRALETAPRLGHGHGPVNHLHTVSPFEDTHP